MRDPERARSALKDVKRLGVSIALDKFGSGKYSLGLPSNLPLDVLKLDRMLVSEFDRDKERRAMFAATIALAKEAGLTAVAVGIETNRQLALARELDCSVGQGFLLHGPASARARAPQGERRGGNVRAMASSGAAGRQRSAPLSDEDSIARTSRPRHAPRPSSWRTACAWGSAAGSTVAHLLPALAERGLRNLRCVATSPADRAGGARARPAGRTPRRGRRARHRDRRRRPDRPRGLAREGRRRRAHAREDRRGGRAHVRRDRLRREGRAAARPARPARAAALRRRAHARDRSPPRGCATGRRAPTAG